MKNCLKPLNRQIKFSVFFFSAMLSLAACSEKEKTDKYVAKVNDSYLTEEQIKAALSNEIYSGKTREDFINEWIQREVLYQQAVKEGILKDDLFKSLMENSEKELAATLFMNKMIDKEKYEPAEDEIKEYYEKHKDEFKLKDYAYRVNILYFSDFDKAVKFRNSAVESNWKNSSNMMKNDPSVYSNEEGAFMYRYQVEPQSLLRTLANLNNDEISVVLELGKSNYAVVQLLQEFEKDSLPPYELTKGEIKEKLIIIRKKEIIKTQIDKLIADHNLEIKRYSE